MNTLIDTLVETHSLPSESLLDLILNYNDSSISDYLFQKARLVSLDHFNTSIYMRGLIEFTNYCKNDCFYCGIRKSNIKCKRYRLDEKTILDCCNIGYDLGLRTFVLQGGEDPYFTDLKICHLISSIKEAHPDCALTLSIGEKSHASYRSYFLAGADRYLLRHETATSSHYYRLHPEELSLAHRKHCLYDLKEIGYQVGAGFMVGSPFQTPSHLVNDLLFLQDLKPHMIGIGPFIPQKDTPLGSFSCGNVNLSLFMLALLRLMFPHALLPATTALGTVLTDGREKGILAGANVVMPNLSPMDVRAKYTLYDNKLYTGTESAQCIKDLELRLKHIGYHLVIDRGDYKN